MTMWLPMVGERQQAADTERYDEVETNIFPTTTMD